MGIHLNLIPILSELAQRCRFSGSLCTLGVQDLPAGEGESSFFSKFGFTKVETLDISAYEGAQHIFDLNEPDLPSQLAGRFDAVLNGGTLEHVFHIPNALTSITRMLRPGGYAIHILPCNGWVDHGFFQISPTLMFDYYAAAGFDTIESVLISFEVNRMNDWLFTPLGSDGLSAGTAGGLGSGIHLYLFVAQRSATVIESPIPTQRLYAGAKAGGQPFRPASPLPYRVVDGARQELSIQTKVAISGARGESGHCWIAPLPGLAESADSPARPSQSRLLLFEDGTPIGPAHASHQTVRNYGRGAYSHWGDTLYFSASDNTDPTTNGRAYTAIVPELIANSPT